MGAKQAYPNLRHFQTLREQLSLYGLNPTEWNIFAQRERSNTYGLEHREDPTFKINVRVRPIRAGRLRVDQLSVVSL